MVKKAMAALTALALTAGFAPSAAFASAQSSQIPYESAHYTWFKDQLTPTAQKFYAAFEQMYANGDLAKGNCLYDVTDLIGQDALEGYALGNTQLLYEMGAARDAFDADYPELFYIDFSEFTLRVTTDNKKYRATLGTGRSDNYLADGIQTGGDDVAAKVAALDGKVDEIVSGATGTDRAKAVYVHDTIVKETTDYASETDARAGNAAYVRGAYGALVCGESVCKGYAKAYKLIMDRLGIPCVTVQGVYEDANSGGAQEHMWNYVELDGVWYAVDATMDDPRNSAPTQEYLLCNMETMGATHTANGVLSEANFEFTYPALNALGGGTDGEGDADFTITVGETETDGELSYYDLTVSYKGMGQAAAAEQGYYFLIDYNGEGKWAYITPSLYAGAIVDTQTSMTFPVNNSASVSSIQFGITQTPKSSDSLSDLYFSGDASEIVKSETVTTSFSSTYYSPPYIYSVTPSNQTYITPGKEYDVVVTYSKALKQTGEISVTFTSDSQIATNGSTLTDVQWSQSEPNVLRFKFTASLDYGGVSCFYYFNLSGLVGADSDKAPNSLALYAKNSAFYCCPTADGWAVYGTPVLLQSGDLSAEDWTYADGTSVADNVSFRLALIASKASESDNQYYQDIIEDKGVSVLSSETYNLTLSLCEKQIASLGEGQRLKIMLPYPDGYDPEDVNTSFRAYHFDKDNNSEEIECYMNEYGIVIFCRSFSPFTVVEVEAQASDNKNVLITATKGGTVSDDLISLSQGSRQVTVTPSAGYVIDSITVGGKPVAVSDENGCTLELSYDSLGANTTVDVRFVAKSVKDAETAAGVSVVVSSPFNSPLPKAQDDASALNTVIVVSCVAAAAVAVVIAAVLVVMTLRDKKRRGAR